MPSAEEDQFNNLPKFDASKFQPPAWAKTTNFQWDDKNGESSKATAPPAGRQEGQNILDLGDDESDDSGDDVFEDAHSTVDPEEAMFTTSELKELLSRATKHKATGNSHYTSKPPRYDDAIVSYKLAIDHLPTFPSDLTDPEQDSKNDDKGKAKVKEPVPSGLQEVSEEEAVAIEEAEKAKEGKSPEELEREEVEDEIKECTKACWGNLAACYIATKDDENAVKACTEALKIDPHYTKGLHRRATANERLGTLAALTSAQQDYTLLKTLLPASSPLLPSIRRSLIILPPKIKSEEKKQYDEMMSKLKDLGNSLLGNFGLSTDNFKFEQQPGGGYSMNFNK
ncbi:hypothetical protein CNBG_3209 [Cryptococcus deuterogattii R265]|uniref:Uncharacterized protein n=1 Tax=Cryptococcus deuterogattii (strain R265) TaxID=294750 RepID=A0A095D8H6_CRYD2|nr:hypothetical protein CNBG_3209 [Cryptococcus deuterogattii R265]KIR30189.1 hypothetical protein I309_01060 [Cryptococcus deuterogattii LA55]KIR37223.1 hypothetical protein I352_00535 [Cryptococcus deuterogattii MMRL2647]KIR75025.1 hypothetical protein I310_01299 [Cryptococcus deuterogattii CA1014]KIR92694.1 hypothetical protein I304_03271 [Cryptococcus deuterogattii CBS 10090]